VNETRVDHFSDIPCPNGTKKTDNFTCKVNKEYCGLELTPLANQNSILPCPEKIVSPYARYFHYGQCNWYFAKLKNTFWSILEDYEFESCLKLSILEVGYNFTT